MPESIDEKLASLEKQLEIQKQIEAGFGGFSHRFDELRTCFAKLADRVHALEIQMAKDQVGTLRETVDTLVLKVAALEVRAATDSVRLKLVLTGIGFGASILGSVLTHFMIR